MEEVILLLTCASGRWLPHDGQAGMCEPFLGQIRRRCAHCVLMPRGTVLVCFLNCDEDLRRLDCFTSCAFHSLLISHPACFSQDCAAGCSGLGCVEATCFGYGMLGRVVQYIAIPGFARIGYAAPQGALTWRGTCTTMYEACG